ncbi:MAG: hydroxyacid dehydrogenase [Phycisphaera sp.]|nr:hydroxyacid dehydrogenase [Phycisphaera sp.]
MTATPHRPCIVVTHRVHPEVIELLSEHGNVVANDTLDSWSHDELVERAQQADALMLFMPDRVDAAMLDHCRRLRVIAGALKGFDNVDVEACAERGVWVSIVPDLLTEPTAELAIALLLGLLRNVAAGDRYVRTERFTGWRPTLYGATLGGATVGIVGMGEVGRAVARRLAGFGCELIYHDLAPLNVADEAALRVSRRDLPTLLAESHVLILAAPLTPDSRHLIGGSALLRLRRGAYVVNVGRGSVIDERAVVALLADDHLAGYAADVYEMEDLSLPNRPKRITPGLIERPGQTLLTPHLGSAVADVRRQIELSAARCIIDTLEGRTPRHAVNTPGDTVPTRAG